MLKIDWMTNTCQLSLLALFIYSAGSKILDFRTFYSSLLVSPLVQPEEVTFVAKGVIGVELFVSLLLGFEKTKMAGLFAALFLMISYSFYLISLVSFFERAPCACGGILGNLGYTAHIAFNLIFVSIAVIGILSTHAVKCRQI
jgi:hypothetical protein